MTEAEWLAADKYETLWNNLGPRATPRVLRLFGCACCRIISYLFADPRLSAVVDQAEQYADGLIAQGALFAAHVVARQIHSDVEQARPLGIFVNEYPSSAVAYTADPLDFWDMHHAAGVCAADTTWAIYTDNGRPHEWIHEQIVGLVREVFGNPFRRVKFNKKWRTDTALTLARQMYESRDFSAMPILADALQDAGCDDAEVLNHCRAGGVHVRGCWVVDLVLDKQ